MKMFSGKEMESLTEFLREVKSLRVNNTELKTNQSLTYAISNCIHMKKCKKNNCNIRYVGETNLILKFRLADHIRYVSKSKKEVQKRKALHHKIQYFLQRIKEAKIKRKRGGGCSQFLLRILLFFS